jgi:hypothetical protein
MFTLKIKSFDKLQLLSFLYIIFFIVYSNAIFKKFWYLKLILLLIIVFSFFVEIHKKQMLIVLLGIVGLQSLITFYLKYYMDGNHCFVLIYFGLVLILSHLFYNEREMIILKNTFWMAVIIMFFGALHKLLSHKYLTGDFMNFLYSRGDLFKITHLYEPLKIYFESNKAAILAFNEIKPNEIAFIKLPVFFKNQNDLLYYFGWFVIFIEFVFVLVMFIKNQFIKHIFFLIFLFSLLLTRQETGFLSLVSLICFAQLPKDYNRFIYLSYLFFFFLCLLLIHLGKGFF